MLAAPPLLQIVFSSPPKGSRAKCTQIYVHSRVIGKICQRKSASMEELIRRHYRLTSEPQTYHMVTEIDLCPRSLCTAKRLCVAL